MHVVETSTVLFGPDVYNVAVGLFRNLPARLGEILLMAALVYHALNGLRVIAMDFWPRLTVYYRPLTYGVIVATVVAMIPLCDHHDHALRAVAARCDDAGRRRTPGPHDLPHATRRAPRARARRARASSASCGTSCASPASRSCILALGHMLIMHVLVQLTGQEIDFAFVTEPLGDPVLAHLRLPAPRAGHGPRRQRARIVISDYVAAAAACASLLTDPACGAIAVRLDRCSAWWSIIGFNPDTAAPPVGPFAK